MYNAIGTTITYKSASGEIDVVATCNKAEKAVELLNESRFQNDRKHAYTAAARLMAKAEQLDGFKWVN